MGEVDLAEGFNRLWDAIPNSGQVSVVMSIIAVIIVIITVVPWLWQRRKGGMNGFSGFPWIAVVIAGILAGPQLVFPLILNILSVILNLFVMAVDYILSLF